MYRSIYAIINDTWPQGMTMINKLRKGTYRRVHYFTNKSSKKEAFYLFKRIEKFNLQTKQSKKRGQE